MNDLEGHSRLSELSLYNRPFIHISLTVSDLCFVVTTTLVWHRFQDNTTFTVHDWL